MIDQALAKIPKDLFEKIFVTDDCSIDNTKEEYEKRGFKVFSKIHKHKYISRKKILL